MPSAGDTAGIVPRSKVLKLLLTTAAAIALGVFEELADPFGLDSQTDRLSANIFITITAPFYGKEWGVNLDDGHFGSRYGQSNVIVLLIDDQYLRQSGQSWPLEIRHYRRILRKLVDAGASAVALDIWFVPDVIERRDSLANLYRYANCLERSAACGIDSGDRQCGGSSLQVSNCISPDIHTGTGIVFASTFHDPQLRLLGEKNKIITAPPHAALAELDSKANFYPLVQQRGETGAFESVAWSTYKEWCYRDSHCNYHRFEKYSIDRPMFLHWGSSPNDMMTRHPAFGGLMCQAQARRIIARIVQSFRIFWVNMIRGFEDAKELNATCPYSSQINLHLFNTLSGRDLKQLFAGKTVLIGASLERLPDWQYSPVHGYLPGVFLHAMAVDNLIEFGESFMQAAPDKVGDSLEAAGLIALFSLQGLMSWIILRREYRERPSEFAAVKLDLLHGLLVIVLISATVLWMTGLNHWAPANWIGFAMLMFLIDHKPIKALPRFCWMILPASRLTHRPYQFIASILAAGFLMLALLFLGYCLFITPHALILARELDDQVISISFLSIYFVISIYCAWKITLGRMK